MLDIKIKDLKEILFKFWNAGLRNQIITISGLVILVLLVSFVGTKYLNGLSVSLSTANVNGNNNVTAVGPGASANQTNNYGPKPEIVQATSSINKVVANGYMHTYDLYISSINQCSQIGILSNSQINLITTPDVLQSKVYTLGSDYIECTFTLTTSKPISSESDFTFKINN